MGDKLLPKFLSPGFFCIYNVAFSTLECVGQTSWVFWNLVSGLPKTFIDNL